MKALPLVLLLAGALAACDGAGVPPDERDTCPIRPPYFEVGEYLYGSWGPHDLLAVLHRPTDSTGRFDGNRQGIYTLRPDGAGLAKVITQVELGEPIFRPKWSPDGAWIAFTNGVDLYKIRPDGSGLTRLTVSDRDKYRFAWSPDGQHLAYGTLMTDSREERGFYVVDTEGRRQERFLKRPPPNERCIRCPSTDSWYVSYLDWSPDGREIVYAAFENHKGNAHLALYDTATARVQRLREFEGPIEHPTFSPDGSRILFDDRHNIRVGSVRRDGSDLRWLADPGQEPEWSADGRRVLYRRLGWKDYDNHRNPGYGELWAVDGDGKRNRQLTWSRHSLLGQPVPVPDWCAAIRGGTGALP